MGFGHWCDQQVLRPFRITSNYLANADEIQIKISQGAKPVKGSASGITPMLSSQRHAMHSRRQLDKPPTPKIAIHRDLSEIIYDEKRKSYARIGVKLVSEMGGNCGSRSCQSSCGSAFCECMMEVPALVHLAPSAMLDCRGKLFDRKHIRPWENNLRGRVRLMTMDLKFRTRYVIASSLARRGGFGTSVLLVLGVS